MLNTINVVTPSSKFFNQDIRMGLYNPKGNQRYADALKLVQEKITDTISKREKDIDEMMEEEVKDVIKGIIVDNKITCNLTDDLAVLLNYLYHDMAKYSFISRENLLETPGVEQIDIDSYNYVTIVKNGVREKTEYSFLDPEHAENTIKRMLQVKSVIINQTKPYAESDIGSNIRMASMLSPIMDKDAGIACSIRKVHTATLTKEQLLATTVTQDMMDLLMLCIRHGASICFSGATNSGKTALCNYLQRQIAKDVRIFSIEERARELDFVHRDEKGERINSVVHTRTVPNEEKKMAVTQDMLLELALRFNPDIITVGEMRSIEAFAALNAALTGHTLLTTIHANSAADAPKRIMILCKMAVRLDDVTLMDMIADAWPIQVSHRRMPDGTRRVREIIEVLGYENGKIQYQTLFEYKVEDTVYTEDGKCEIKGGFRQVSAISDQLYQRLIDNGASRNKLERLRKGAKI